MNFFVPMEYQNQRILTTAQLAEAYGTDPKYISYNFNNNKDRYKEGKHYFALSGEAKRDFLNRHEIHDGSKNAAVLYLWTEKGAWMHAKSLNTDQAWEAYEKLVDEYYRIAATQPSHSIQPTVRPNWTLVSKEIRAKVSIGKALGIDHSVAAALALEHTEQELGIDMRPWKRLLRKPDITQSYNPTEIGQMLVPEQSGRKVNRLLEQAGFQIRNMDKEWELTEKGREYAELLPVMVPSKGTGVTTTKFAIRWKENVVAVLQRLLDKQREEKMRTEGAN